ncbi:MAG: hypothetical protein WC773_02600 [Patescibacteria group bacterium]
MYFYIADPPQTKVDQTAVAAIRARLIPDGIAGEFVFRTPGQSAATLAKSAIDQGYSTIVAVGNEYLAAEIAGTIYDQPIALGVLPINASPDLAQIIGYSDWRVGIKALRHRKIILRDIGVINAELFFLSEVKINSAKPQHFYLHTDRFSAEIFSNIIRITLCTGEMPFAFAGLLNFYTTAKNGPIWSKSIFGKPAFNVETLMRSDTAVIQSESDCDVVQDGHAIAKMPISLSVIPQSVRIITARQLHTEAE